MHDPPHRLLVLACTATKRPDLGQLPALQRYDGPSFRTVRRWRMLNPCEAERLDVLILSARLGLITADAPIEDYDQRMTQRQALALQPAVSAALHQFFALHSSYAATLIHLGQDYLPALVPDLGNGLDAAGHARHIHTQLATIAGVQPGIITLTAGGIGTQLGQIKRWLEDPHG
jgi:hypothetical protein